MGKNIGDKNMSAVMNIPMVCPISLINTDVADKNQLKPSKKKISGNSTIGNCQKVTGIPDIVSNSNINSIDRLINAWNSAESKLTMGSISNGNIILVTKLALLRIVVGALETHSEKKLKMIIPTKSTIANSVFEPVPVVQRALKTSLKTKV